MKECAGEAQALYRAGRERTHLTVKSFFQTELLREMSDAMSGGGFRKMVKAAKEAQVFAAGKAGIEADIAASVIAKLAANGGRIENNIVARDLRATVGWGAAAWRECGGAWICPRRLRPAAPALRRDALRRKSRRELRRWVFRMAVGRHASRCERAEKTSRGLQRLSRLQARRNL